MEGGGTGEEKEKKSSFGFSIADEKIKLIDMYSEDDEFLVDSSPFCDSTDDSSSDITRGRLGFRLTGFGNSPEVEIIQQNEENLLPSNSVQQTRPSYMRRSLAWDDAFLDTPGVLDPDELSFINKGFTLDVRKRRPGSGSTPNSDNNHLDWFEIEPSIYEAKSSKVLNVANTSTLSGLKQEGLQSVQVLKNVDRSFRNKSAARMRQRTISSPKPPKALGRTTYMSTRSNNRDLSGNTTGSGQSSVIKKKSAPLSSSSLTSTSLSSPKFSSTESKRSRVSASLSTSKIWRHAERSKGMGNINLSTLSLSLPNNPSCPSPASSTSHYSSESLSSSVVNNQRSIDLDRMKTSREPVLHSDVTEASDLQSNLKSPLCSPKQYSSQAKVRPSRLRPPSPQMRFFDENTPPRYHGLTKSRKMPQKAVSQGTSFGANTHFDYLDCDLLPGSSISSIPVSACKKLKSPYCEVPKNTKRPKTDRMNTSLVMDKRMCLDTGKSVIVDHGKRPRNKLRLTSSLEEEKRRGILKNKRCRESRGPNNANEIHTEVVNRIKKGTDQEIGKTCSEDQVGSLSRCLTAIDLNREKVIELSKNSKRKASGIIKNHSVSAYSVLKQEKKLLNSPMVSSKLCQLSPSSVPDSGSVSSTRTPLADKTFIGNFIRTFASPMEPKKEKLVQKASSVYAASEVVEKENS